MDEADQLINGDRPVVQECEQDRFVEVVFPHNDETVALHEDVVLEMFMDLMRVVGNVDVSDLPRDQHA